jgi:membrane protease YdiL (CAAX protease family)
MTTLDKTIPLIRSGWLRAAIFTLVFFGYAVVATSIAAIILVTSHTAGVPNRPDSLLVTVLLFLHAVMGVVLTTVFRRLIDRKTVMSMGFQWRQYQPDAITGFCLGVALPTLGTLILYAIKKLQWTEAGFSVLDFSTGIITMVLVAIGEEMVFRGYILNNLMDSMDKWLALGISAAIFAMAHGGNAGISAMAVINLVLGGLLLGINYIYTRNLWFAIFFHFSWNFVQGPVLGYEVSGMPLHSILQHRLQGADWVTGGAFGFEGSCVATVIFILTLLALYLVYEGKQ